MTPEPRPATESAPGREERTAADPAVRQGDTPGQDPSELSPQENTDQAGGGNCGPGGSCFP
jgi:hypothetical protein